MPRTADMQCPRRETPATEPTDMRHTARTTRASADFIARLRLKAEEHLQGRIDRYLAEAGEDACTLSREELLAIVTREVRREITTPKRTRARCA